MKNIIIRNAEYKDIPDVIDIRIKAWQTAYKGIIDDDFLFSINKDDKVKKLRDTYKKTGFIVAVSNNSIAGFCRYKDLISSDPDTLYADCELLAIYVKPELKYNGIGTKMFSHVIKEFKSKGKKRMILWCLKDNDPAKNFYVKQGGKIIKEKLVSIGSRKLYEVCFMYEL